jgi:hypothetical protein
LQDVQFIQASYLLLPDSSTFSLSSTKAEGERWFKAKVGRFASQDLAYFQSGRGRCKELEKRIAVRSEPVVVRPKEDQDAFPFISFFVYGLTSLVVIGSAAAFSYLR